MWTREFAGRADEIVPFEIELWYRASQERRAEAVEVLRAGLERAGGRVHQEVTIHEIAYHGLLGTAPAKRGRQCWGTARTKAEARRLKRNAETDVERGQHRDLSRATFGEYARDWIEDYSGRTSSGVRESTRRWYRQMLEDRLIPYFDQARGLRLAEIEPRDIKALVAWLAQRPNPHDPARTLGRSTIGYHVAVLRALFADAVEEGVLRSSPTTGLRVAVPVPTTATSRRKR